MENYKFGGSAFSKPPYQDGTFSGPLADRARTQSGFDYGNIANRRDSYYRSQNYQPPPYVFNTSPSFGIFNTLFLFWMLDHITNRNVAKAAYNYSDDPAFQKWRQEAENLAKDNSELRSKLAEMDKQIKALQGTPKDPGYLPPDVPLEAALAPGAFGQREGGKPVLRFAGGQKGGWYEKFLTLFEKNCSGLAVKPILTSGSLENLKLLASGQADMALVQSDVLAMREAGSSGKDLVTEQTTLFLEYVQLLANREGGVKSLQDLDPAKHVVYVGPKESGTAQTWQSLCRLDPALARIKTKNADYYEALARVEKDPNSLMLFVGGLKSDFLKKAEEAASQKDRLRLIPIDDKRFTELRDKHGNTVYHLSTIPARIYPHLQKGWFFGHDVKTLTVQAVLVLRNEWAATFGSQAMDTLSASILETRPMIEKMVNG
ncbi:MAG: TAXI family TRAP transporter solute-binding subunit [Desulfomonilaceae bacterium]